MPRPDLGGLVELGVANERLLAGALDGRELDGVVHVRGDQPADEPVEPGGGTTLPRVLEDCDHRGDRSLLREVADLDTLAVAGRSELERGRELVLDQRVERRTPALDADLRKEVSGGRLRSRRGATAPWRRGSPVR